jgi:hypothetical protein
MMAASQAQKEVVFNEFLIAMDALFRGVVISATLTAPPSSPNAGDTYIIGSGATGAWSGQDKNIAFYFNGWQFVTAKDHMRLYDQSATVWRVYHANTTSWDAEPASTVSVLTDLTNVQGSPTDGQVLTYVMADGKWEPKTPVAAVGALRSLSDVQVTEGPALDGKALAWNNADGKWEGKTFLTAVPGFMSLPGVTSPTDLADNWVAAYDASGPCLTFVNPASLITVSSLAQVGDVAYPLGGAGSIPANAYLQWNGAAWVPSTSAVSVSVESLSDGPGSFTGQAGKLLRVNIVETKLEYVSPGAALGISLENLTDVAVTTGSTIDGYVLYWNNGAGKWQAEALAAVAKTGAYSDLTGKPSLARVATSGAYGDLTGKPALAAVALSGAYSDLSGQPAPPTNGSFSLSGLSDVSVSEGVGIDGFVLKWDNATSKWVAAKSSGGGGSGSSTLAGDTDVSILSPTEGQVLTYNAASSKWKNATPTGGGGTTLLSPHYELGSFAPPDPSWFDMSGSALPTTMSTVANRGAKISAAVAVADKLCFGRRSVSAWGSNWSVTARVMPSSNLNSNYPGVGLFVQDTSGKITALMVQGQSGSLKASLINFTNNTTYSATPASDTVHDAPTWFKVSYDGTNLTFGLSYNGLDYAIKQVAATSFLGTLAYVGIGGDCHYESGPTFNPATWSVLCTHYSDPDYPAAGHTAMTSAHVGDLADASVGLPGDGQVLMYQQSTGKWINGAIPTVSGLSVAFSPPRVIQAKAFVGGDAPFPLDNAPTVGNLLVAFVSHWAASTNAGAGWTRISDQRGTNDYVSICYKAVPPGDSPSQSPVTGCNGAGVTIFELSGANQLYPVSFNAVTDQAGPAVTMSVGAPDGSIALGCFTTTTSAGLPAITGATAGPTASGASGSGQGWGRSVASFYSTFQRAGGVAATATYGGTSVSNGVILVVNGALTRTSAGGIMTPPDPTVLSAVQNLGGATLTTRYSGGSFPSLHVKPGVGTSGGTLYCALQAAPGSTFSLVTKFKTVQITADGGWKSAGLVVYNSANSNSTYSFISSTVASQLYCAKFAGGFTGGTPGNNSTLSERDVFLHVDSDGTTYTVSVSYNGIDKVPYFQETIASFLGGITHVGIGWSGNYSSGFTLGYSPIGPEHDFLHYWAGAAGTNGM